MCYLLLGRVSNMIRFEKSILICSHTFTGNLNFSTCYLCELHRRKQMSECDSLHLISRKYDQHQLMHGEKNTAEYRETVII